MQTGKINFPMLISTSAPYLFVPTKICENCDLKMFECSVSPDCTNENANFSYQSRWGSYSGVFMESEMNFFPSKVYKLHFVGITDVNFTSSSIDMVFGLNIWNCDQFCYLNDLTSQKLIANSNFAFSFNMSGVSELILGGYNESYDIKSGISEKLFQETGVTDWNVSISKYNIQHFNITGVYDSPNSAQLDPSYKYIALPSDLFSSYRDNLCSAVNCGNDSIRGLFVEDNPNKVNSAMSDIILSSKTNDFKIPIKSLLFNTNTLVNGYVRCDLLLRDGGDGYILGMPYLSQFHSYFDGENKIVHLMDSVISKFWTKTKIYITIAIAFVVMLIILYFCLKDPDCLKECCR